jgi:hypothetical protein
MDPDFAKEILARENRRRALEAAELESAANYAADLAAAEEQAEKWRQEWARLLSARPALRAESTRSASPMNR